MSALREEAKYLENKKRLHFNVVTLFPELFSGYLETGLVGRAVRKGLVSCGVVSLRDFGEGRHRKVDDYGYGGGPGMILRWDVLKEAHASVGKGTYTLAPSPRGKRLTQASLQRILKKCTVGNIAGSGDEGMITGITIVCGHYEGIDQRFSEECVEEEYSLGDYIISGGELAALVLMDGLIRLHEGVLHDPKSVEEESFTIEGLEYDHYTRPDGKGIPEVLKSGDHQKVAMWREQNSLERTYERRPDLLLKRKLSASEQEILRNYVHARYGYQNTGKK